MGSCIKHLILSTKWCRWKEFGHILHILHDDDSYTCAHIFMVRCFMCHLQFCVAKLLTCLFPDKSLFSLLPCVVGCTCFVQNMSLRLEKLSLTIKFVFVDYSCTQKSYRYYHPACRKYLLLHVMFFEFISFLPHHLPASYIFLILCLCWCSVQELKSTSTTTTADIFSLSKST